MGHAEVMNSCDDKALQVGLSRLTDVERVVVLVSRANFEIELGGLETFYYNSAGNYAVATVAALEAVTATNAAAALKAANALFPGGAPSRGRIKRFKGLQVVRAKPRSPLAKLAQKISEDDPDIFSRLCTYIDLHTDELRTHSNPPATRKKKPKNGGRRRTDK